MEVSVRTDRITLAAETTRVVFLGDPHGDVPALDTVLAREATPGTVFVSVGDNVGYQDGPTSSELIRRLMTRGIASVFGNHEHWMKPDGRLFLAPDANRHAALEPDALEWCRRLPLRLEIDHPSLPDLTVSVQHSLFEDGDWDYLGEENAFLFLEQTRSDVVFAGHSHRPAIHMVLADGVTTIHKLDPETSAPIALELLPGVRYVVDAGSLSRPEVKRPKPPFTRGTFASFDLLKRTLRVESFAKPV